MKLFTTLSALAVTACTALPSVAQPGRLLSAWSFNAPGGPGTVQIGPDNHLYWYNDWTLDYVHKVTPTGQLVWQRRGGDFSFSPDGTRLYHEGYGLSGRRALHAITLAGQSIWTYDVFDADVLQFTAGPSVGPDGSIYGVAGKRIGPNGYAWSISPDGFERWRVNGFNNTLIGPAASLVFDAERVFLAEPIVPGTVNGGVVAAELQTGQTDWIYPYAGRYLGERQLRMDAEGDLFAPAYSVTSEGQERWFVNAGGQSGGPGEAQLDAAGNMYYVNGGTLVTSIDRDGNIRWNVPALLTMPPISGGPEVRRLALSPDGRLLAYTGKPCFAGSCPGQLIVRRTSDGSVVLNMPLPAVEGVTVSPMDYRPTFTADSSRLYVPVYEFASSTRGWLLTFCVQGACPNPAAAPRPPVGLGATGIRPLWSVRYR